MNNNDSIKSSITIDKNYLLLRDIIPTYNDNYEMQNIDNLNQHIGSNFNNERPLTNQNSNDDIINKLKKNSNENNSNPDNFVTILQSFFGKSIIMDTALVFGLRMLLCFFRDICNDMNEIYCNSLRDLLQIKLSFPYPLALLFEKFCNKTELYEIRMVESSDFFNKLTKPQQIALLKYTYEKSIVKQNGESSFKLDIDFSDETISVEEIFGKFGWSNTTLSFGYPLNNDHHQDSDNFIWNESCYKDLAYTIIRFIPRKFFNNVLTKDNYNLHIHVYVKGDKTKGNTTATATANSTTTTANSTTNPSNEYVSTNDPVPVAHLGRGAFGHPYGDYYRGSLAINHYGGDIIWVIMVVTGYKSKGKSSNTESFCWVIIIICILFGFGPAHYQTTYEDRTRISSTEKIDDEIIDVNGPEDDGPDNLGRSAGATTHTNIGLCGLLYHKCDAMLLFHIRTFTNFIGKMLIVQPSQKENWITWIPIIIDIACFDFDNNNQEIRQPLYSVQMISDKYYLKIYKFDICL